MRGTYTTDIPNGQTAEEILDARDKARPGHVQYHQFTGVDGRQYVCRGLVKYTGYRPGAMPTYYYTCQACGGRIATSARL